VTSKNSKNNLKKLSGLDKDTIIVAYDQAHFNIDADVRRVWAKIGTTPIIYKNGSKEGINVGGAYTSTNEFYFYFMDRQVKEEVLWNIKLLRMKYPKMFLLLDKATWNKNNFVLSWLEENEIEYMLFPTGASDLNPVEECWRQTRDNVTFVSHNSIKELEESLEKYWESNPFRHNVLSYLSP
jgi:putative transposase